MPDLQDAQPAPAAPKSTGEAAQASHQKAQDRAAKRPGRPPRPRMSEAEINSPDRLTLVLLAGIFVVTGVSWGAARFACNLHPPESRPPPKLSIEKLAATPKDAAIELQQRLETRDFSGALALASGTLEKTILADKQQCEKDALRCAEEKTRAAKAQTVATVLSVTDDSAEVRVKSLVGSATKAHRITLTREGQSWKGIARVPLPQDGAKPTAP